MYEDAGRLYQRAVQIQESVLGLNHPELAETLHATAELSHSQVPFQNWGGFPQDVART